MAYLDLDTSSTVSATEHAATPAARADTAFTALEWSVIAIARRDTLHSLRQPGRMSRALGSLFGGGAAPSLADPRLEALRRIAVHAWRRGFALPMAEVERFLSAGFTEAQIAMLIASVTGMRIGTQRRETAA